MAILRLRLFGRPMADQETGDGAFWRDGDAFRAFPVDDPPDFDAAEPAAILEFVAVEMNVSVERLSIAADHQ